MPWDRDLVVDALFANVGRGPDDLEDSSVSQDGGGHFGMRVNDMEENFVYMEED